jgi:hypothetical protein
VYNEEFEKALPESDGDMEYAAPSQTPKSHFLPMHIYTK